MSYTDSIINNNGVDLVIRHWSVPTGTDIKAKIVFVHGFSEHNDGYNAWWPGVAKAGYDVTMFDQRGFGKTAATTKEYGITTDDDQFKDLDRVIASVIDDSSVPMILWGHSMGGGIVLNYMVRGTLRDKFAAYIANSPYIVGHPDGPNGMFVVKLIPIANKVVPGMRQKVKIGPEICTNDPVKQKSYARDPLRHNTGTVRLFSDMMNRGKCLLDPGYVSRTIDRPLLLNQGDNDLLCDVKGAREYFSLLKISDKTLKVFPGMPHELMQLKSPEVEEQQKLVLEWLDKRFGEKKPEASNSQDQPSA